jgi:RNA polymerase-binding transcription factor DksA
MQVMRGRGAGDDVGNTTLTNPQRGQLRTTLEAEQARLQRELPLVTAGTCEDCGSPIPFERLELRPSASNCVRCVSER